MWTRWMTRGYLSTRACFDGCSGKKKTLRFLWPSFKRGMTSARSTLLGKTVLSQRPRTSWMSRSYRTRLLRGRCLQSSLTRSVSFGWQAHVPTLSLY